MQNLLYNLLVAKLIHTLLKASIHLAIIAGPQRTHEK